MKIKSIAVYCGSSLGNDHKYKNVATKLGHTLALHNIKLVYGGAQIGLMGAVADGALDRGGSVIGIAPKFLSRKEIVHDALSELIIVDDMHERKTKMFELSDAFIILPGGFGTLEELFEVTTWAQLNLHEKPIGIINVNGFYNHLQSHIEHMINEGFLKPPYKELIMFDDNIENLVARFQAYSPIKLNKLDY